MAATKKTKAATAKRATRTTRNAPAPKKKPAAKKVVRRVVGAKKPAAKKTTASMAQLGNIGKVLQGIKVSGAASVLLDGRRKDVDALLKLSRKSYKEVEALVKKRSRELKKAIGDWKDAAKKMHVSDPKASLLKLETIGNQAFKLATKNLHDLSELATKSQGDALDVIKKRIRENVADVKKLLHKK
jgi:phasin family protein